MQIVLPKVGLTVLEAEVGEWACKPGDRVSAGDVIVEIHTDKVDLDVEAPASGVLTAILVESGTVVDVGTPIATLNTGDDDVATPPAEPETYLAPVEVTPDPAPEPDPARHPTADDVPSRVRESVGPLATMDAMSAVPTGTVQPRPRSSPRARAAAARHGVDLRDVVGSGPQGRIVSRDVESVAQAEPSAPVSVVVPAPVPAPSSMPDLGVTSPRVEVSRQVVLPAGMQFLATDDWLATWVHALARGYRQSGLVATGSDAPDVAVLHGRDLDHERAVPGAGDLNMHGVLARLSTTIESPPRTRPQQAHVLLVDLRDSDAETWADQSDLSTITLVLGAPEAFVEVVEADVGGQAFRSACRLRVSASGPEHLTKPLLDLRRGLSSALASSPTGATPPRE